MSRRMNDARDDPRPIDPAVTPEARVGDRSDASGRNIEQNRAIGQPDPVEAGSRQGRDAAAGKNPPASPDAGTDAVQNAEAEAARTADSTDKPRRDTPSHDSR